VCVEGIETEAEALCAIDANADLMQGDYFAPGSAELPPENACSEKFARLIAGHRADFAEFQKRQHARLVPYLATLKNAVQDLSLGHRPQALGDSLVRFRVVRRVAAGAVRRSRFCGARRRGYGVRRQQPARVRPTDAARPGGNRRTITAAVQQQGGAMKPELNL